jgi:hypothetical protein
MMNDEELITLVRQQRANVPMTTPVEEIISRGRTVRTRRRIPALAATLALAGGAAVAVAALAPGGHQAPRLPGAQLAAWTVTRQADGDIHVTIRELLDPAGLQATLRADGVPASVNVRRNTNLHSACQPYPASRSQREAIVQFGSGQSGVLIIDPSAIPRGVGLAIDAFPVSAGKHHRPAYIDVGAGLVYASRQCTDG